SQPREELDGLCAGRAKNSENLGLARRPIGTLFGKSVAVDGEERWVDLMQRALEAHVISIDLYVAHMADLFNRSERLARRALPRGRRPMFELRGNGRVVSFQLLWESRERAQGNAVHSFETSPSHWFKLNKSGNFPSGLQLRRSSLLQSLPNFAK